MSLNVASAISLLPSDVQAGLGTIRASVSQAAPLIGLAQMAASGQSVSEGAALGGMVAIASTINPIAGAALGAAGSLVEGAEQGLKDVFTALGWINADPPLKPANVLPWGPDDPIWWHIASVNDLSNPPAAQRGGYVNPNVGAFQLLQNALQALKTPGYSPSYPTPALNDFDRFFLPILVKDLERWINAAPFISPRDLLGAAASAWNKMRGNETTAYYAPTTAAQGTHNLTTKVVSQILGPGGGLEIAPPLTVRAPMSVNMGQPTAAASLGLQSVPTANLPTTLHFGAAGASTTVSDWTKSPLFAPAVAKFRQQGWSQGVAILKARDEVLAANATALAAKNAASAAANQAAVAANIAAMGPQAAAVRAKQLTYQAQGMSEQDAAARAFGEMAQASAAATAKAAAPSKGPWWLLGGATGGAAVGFALGGPLGALLGAAGGFVGVEAAKAGLKKYSDGMT